MPELPQQIRDAWQARGTFHADPETDCYRLFHGYSEGLPGLSIDRYGPCAIINKKVDLPLSDAELVRTLTSLFPFEKIVLKSHQRVDARGGIRVSYLLGSPSSEPLRVKEHGVAYFADLDNLHSNGLFLDARPARRWLRRNATSRRIYNLFAHTGSLGVAAMVGGAKEVVHLDKSQDALDKVRLSYEFNALRHDGRALLKGDLYYHLPRAIKWGKKFQGIILDPPPFIAPPVRAPDHKPSGQDFTTLIHLTSQLLDAGGWLICIYHDFQKSHDECDEEIVRSSGGTLKAVWRDRADADFPEVDPNRWTRMSAFAKF
jgi:23S rRNA (cytosine1962-C5)-methyltransferase